MTNVLCPEVLLPHSLGTIVNLFKNRLADCRLSGAAIEVVLKLAHDFVYALADKANGICNKNGKKTIVNRHVLTALKVLSLHPRNSTSTTILRDFRPCMGAS